MKGGIRLKLWLTGLVFIVSAAVLWVAVISWGWGKSDRNTIFLVVRCVYAVGIAVAAAAGNRYAAERTQRPPLRPWILIPLVIVIGYMATGPLVDSLLARYPNGLSIRCTLAYTVFLVVAGTAGPAHYYAARYYRHRKGTLSDDHTCCSDENKKT